MEIKDFKIEPVNEEDTTYIDLNGHKTYCSITK